MRYAALLLICVFLAACTQWRYDLGEPLSPAAQKIAAETALPLGEVLARLGPPLRISALPGGFALAWEYWEIRENLLGFSLGAMGVDFLSIDWGEAHARSQFLLLNFNDEHRLTGGSYQAREGVAGGGGAVQPFVSIVPVVDIEDMVDHLPQHAWGRGQLEPLPISLNRKQSPNHGQGGVSQRDAPVGIGQQALELR